MTERVLGIGGVFFRARDPKALRAWYMQHLGIEIEAYGGTQFEGGQTVWSIFDGDTDYWPAERQFMINYRVADLDAMLAQLRAAGATVDDKVMDEGYGRFGWAVDPEGNRFELWQPR